MLSFHGIKWSTGPFKRCNNFKLTGLTSTTRFAKYLTTSTPTSSGKKEKLDATFNGQKITIDRELPDPFQFKYTNRKYFVAYGIGVVVSCIVIFNYEKTTSPILNSVFYLLRRNQSVVGKLGENIGYKSSWPWIWGELNTVKGQIDISFDIKGDKGVGTMFFKASRPSKAVPFTIHHWYINIDDDTVDLKSNDSIDFGF